MTKLTKEFMQDIISGNGFGLAPSAVTEMARQLLASMEQEPVAWLLSGGGAKNHVSFDSGNAYADPLREVTPLYAAPQLPQTAVLSVPDEIPKLKDVRGFKYVKDGVRYSLNYANGWNACRAAMLQAEPVSNHDELPLDYLQGHKDGLEWAAQLAEANHPQTGDWLYDDPIELARAIRKGPDMPEFKSASVDEDDNFYSWFGRFWYENYQKNNYTTSAKQMLGTMAEFAYRAGRESAALAGIGVKGE